MRTIKLTLEYDGSDFNGWQIQRGTNRTVQGELKKALRQIFKKDIPLTGSGRTDSGVHALGQVAHFQTDTPYSVDEIRRALNGNLPADISILRVEDAADTFHTQFNAKGKIYRYTICCRKSRPAVDRRFCWHIPGKLNVPAMRKAAARLTGRRNFKSFTASDPALKRQGKSRGTVRTLQRLDIKKRGDFLYIEAEADGFLYKMVRNLVGTLVAVGKGRLSVKDVESILKAKDRSCAAKTAPAQGLSLMKVFY